jgi:hypothetical protein
VTLIPDLERQLADAAARRGGTRRRRAIRSGVVALVLAAAVAALLVVPLLDGAGGEDEQRPVAPAPAVPEPPGGADPDVEDLLGVFRREPTPRDSTGTTVDELEETGDRQPGEDPTRSRRIDLPSEPVYLWRMRDGVCASWGNCLGTRSLRELGVAFATEHRATLGSGSSLRVVSGIVVDGIEEIRLVRPGAPELRIPARDNVFRVDVSRFDPPFAEARWRDWRGERSFDLRALSDPEP